MVSPILAWTMSLMFAEKNPTSPTPSDSTAFGFGVKMPSSAISYSRPVDMNLIFMPRRSSPSIMRTRQTTPRYGSYQESKSSAARRAVGIAFRRGDVR